MHGVGYPGAARDRQAIDIDRFQGHGQFFFLSTWPRRMTEECRQSSSSSLYIMLRDSQRLKHMHTHTEGVKEWSRLTFPIVFPTHSLTHSLAHSPTHIPSHLCSTSYSANSHVSKVKKKKNKKTSESNRPRYITCLRGRVGGGLFSTSDIPCPVTSQSKSVSYMYIFVPNYLMYVGIHYNIHVPMR